MAVTATKYDSDLVLKLQTDTDPGTGEPVIRLRRYSRVKPEASHEAVHNSRTSHSRAAGALAGRYYPPGRPQPDNGIKGSDINGSVPGNGFPQPGGLPSGDPGH